MRTRLLAFFILILLVVFPALLYWYFLKKNTSTVTFIIPKGGPISVKLQGTLAYKYFPLADEALHFSQVCDQKCTIGPIPPVDYTVEISRDGTADISD